MKEALFYDKIEGKKVHCRLCPWECVIADGKLGVCGVRKNEDGTLYSLIYGVVSSIAMDPIEKKPLYHFHPGSKVFSVGSFGCNFKCGFCQNYQIAHVNMAKEKPMGEQLCPEDLIKLAQEKNCQGIAFTYNEPTIWMEYVLDSAKLAKKAGLYTVFVTNGYITPEALDLIGPYLDAYAVDIKSFSDGFYKKICGALKGLTPVLEGCLYAKKKWDMHIEIATLVVPALNDQMDELKLLAEWIVHNLGKDIPWHISRFFPHLNYQHLPMTPIETLKQAYQIGKEVELKHVYIGNVPKSEL